MKIFGLSFLSLTLFAQIVGATPAPPRHDVVPSAKKTSVATKHAPIQAKSKPATSQQRYRVRQGDNLYSIAHAYGMTLGEIKRLNGISDTRLKPGQSILVKGAKKKGKKRSSRAEAPELPVAQPSLSELAEASETMTGAEGIEPIARSYLSIPYRYGAESRRSTDCSGFTQQVFREFDIKLPRTAREQFTVGAKVEKAELQSGDLLFFRSKKKYPTHVGIYLGNGKMIHASRSHRKVVIAEADHPYFAKRFLGAKRIAMFLPGGVDLAALARQVGELGSRLILPAAQASEGLNQIEGMISNSDRREFEEIEAAAGVLGEQEEQRGNDPEAEPEAEPEPEPIAVPELPTVQGDPTAEADVVDTLTDATQGEIVQQPAASGTLSGQ